MSVSRGREGLVRRRLLVAAGIAAVVLLFVEILQVKRPAAWATIWGLFALIAVGVVLLNRDDE